MRDTITRHVRDIETGERRVLEHVIGRHLDDNQKVIIQVVTLQGQLAEAPDQQSSAQPGRLPEWCDVYRGLTSEQIADIEAVILRRSLQTRPSP